MVNFTVKGMNVLVTSVNRTQKFKNDETWTYCNHYTGHSKHSTWPATRLTSTSRKGRNHHGIRDIIRRINRNLSDSPANKPKKSQSSTRSKTDAFSKWLGPNPRFRWVCPAEWKTVLILVFETTRISRLGTNDFFFWVKQGRSIACHYPSLLIVHAAHL